MFIIYAYLVAIFIRPQDWVSSILGFPLVDIIMGAGLLAVVLALLKGKQDFGVPQVKLIFLYLIIILFSNMVRGTTSIAFEYFVFHLKRAATFFVMLVLVSSEKRMKSCRKATIRWRKCQKPTI